MNFWDWLIGASWIVIFLFFYFALRVIEIQALTKSEQEKVYKKK